MSFITALVTSKIAIAALAVGTVAAGGSAVAAYGSSHAPSVVSAAHSSTSTPTDAPTPTATPTPTPTATPKQVPVGPDATGPAAFGLCTAFTHGGLNITSTAYASLVKAAGSAEGIPAYCATVFVAHNTKPTGTPTTVPTAPKGKPTSAPTHPATPHGPSTHKPVAPVPPVNS